ncbi:hypothetical protein BGZ89_007437, partial [Linnemannia elongata]
MTYRQAPSTTKKTTKRKAAADDMIDSNRPDKKSPPAYNDEDTYEQIYNQIPDNDLLSFLTSCCPKCFEDPSK